MPVSGIFHRLCSVYQSKRCGRTPKNTGIILLWSEQSKVLKQKEKLIVGFRAENAIGIFRHADSTRI